jgi:hypothetical protein
MSTLAMEATSIVVVIIVGVVVRPLADERSDEGVVVAEGDESEGDAPGGEALGETLGDALNEASGVALAEVDGVALGERSGDALNEASGEALGERSGDALNEASGVALGEGGGEALGEGSGEALGEGSGGALGEAFNDGEGDGVGDAEGGVQTSVSQKEEDGRESTHEFREAEDSQPTVLSLSLSAEVLRRCSEGRERGGGRCTF